MCVNCLVGLPPIIEKQAIRRKLDCPQCGYFIYCIWGDDDVKWTGRCDSCGTIVMFVDKSDFAPIKIKELV